MWRWDITAEKHMNVIKKYAGIVLLLMFGVSTILAQDYRVIGVISGEQEAGEMYELYKNSASSFLDYLAGWKYVGERDKTRNYSYSEIKEICLNAAKREYRYYSNLEVQDVDYKVKYRDLSDTTYYSHDFSGDEYKKKERSRKVYLYSATVIVRE